MTLNVSGTANRGSVISGQDDSSGRPILTVGLQARNLFLPCISFTLDDCIYAFNPPDGSRAPIV